MKYIQNEDVARAKQVLRKKISDRMKEIQEYYFAINKLSLIATKVVWDLSKPDSSHIVNFRVEENEHGAIVRGVIVGAIMRHHEDIQRTIQLPDVYWEIELNDDGQNRMALEHYNDGEGRVGYGGEVLPHPHMIEDKHVCWGGYQTLIDELLSIGGDLNQLLDITLAFLSCYDVSDSAGRYGPRWFDGCSMCDVYGPNHEYEVERDEDEEEDDLDD